MAVQQEEAIYIIIGHAIRQLRRQSNMTQQELAERLGIMRTSVTNIEAGRQHFPIHMLCTIASIFNVSISTILQEVPLTTEEQDVGVINIQLRLEIIQLRERLMKIQDILSQDKE